MLTLVEAGNDLADDDARRACASMDRDLRAALSGTPTALSDAVARETIRVYVRSLTAQDRSSWRRFFEAVNRVVLLSQWHASAAAQDARTRLRAFLDENRDLESP